MYDSNKYFPNGQRKNRIPQTQFHKDWGMDKHDFAKSEDTTPDAITQRVIRFGTPFQRAKTPNRFERAYGKTAWEIAQERDVSVFTVLGDFDKHGDAYYKTTDRRGANNLRGYDASVSKPNRQRQRFWLHPDHPRYAEARCCKWLGE